MANEKPVVIVDVKGATYVTEYDIRIRKTTDMQTIAYWEQAQLICLALAESLPDLTWKELVKLVKKIDLYYHDKYAFEVPPVSTANWEIMDWIKYIDKCGKWLD